MNHPSHSTLRASVLALSDAGVLENLGPSAVP